MNKEKKIEIEKCKCNNIGLINNDWLCLECGEKVEPRASSLEEGEINDI